MTNLPLVLALILATLNFQLFAQDSEKNLALKVYINVLIESQERSFDFNPNDSLSYFLNIDDYQIGYFTPAVNFIRENGDVHEIEFSRLALGSISIDSLTVFNDSDRSSRLRTGPSLNRIQIAFRYEYQWLINKSNPDTKWKAYLGIAGEPFLRSLNYRSAETTDFPFTLFDVGINISAIPRIAYSLNERWFLDINIPLTVYRFVYQKENNEDPRIPVNDRSVNSFESETLPSIFQVRVGGGIRF